jgi:hypothetical protein
MFDGFIETLITFKRANFYCRTENYFGTEAFEFGDELIRLILSAGDHDRAPGKGLSVQ